ncbi:MAG: hypothetical protein QOJ42_2912 [Acidobacteriaceae bacterium]|nr:hypothetical protein [Acidobacteriaceae bacterium]MDT7812996.1 hypothetical protein [Acidobacteriaceae bacterium]
MSTSNRGKYANAPAAYDVIPNSIELDQAVLYIERLPDEVQRDHFDLGYRIAQIYGLDYRYTTAKGIFSQQLLSSNNTYGYDPAMVYDSLNIRNEYVDDMRGQRTGYRLDILST